MLKNIIDGWSLNTRVRYLPYRPTPMMLGQMEPLRRAHNLRPRDWVLPDDFTIPIPARGQYNRQIRVAPDSYWWAASCFAFINEGEFNFIPVQPEDLAIQITDESTGCTLASEFIDARCFFPGLASTITPPLLTSPRLIAAPGLLSVQIANKSATETLAQLVLYFLEPCDKILEQSQCP
jgi:hypothetical protein